MGLRHPVFVLLFCNAMKRNPQRLYIYFFTALLGLSFIVQIRRIFSEPVLLPRSKRHEHIFPSETNLLAPNPVENASYASAAHLQRKHIHNSRKASNTSLTSNITTSVEHAARPLSQRHQHIFPSRTISPAPNHVENTSYVFAAHLQRKHIHNSSKASNASLIGSLTRNTTTSVKDGTRRSVIMASPMSAELDIFHVKLNLLYEHIDLFIVCECMFALNGLPKVLHFDTRKNETRFAKFLDKVVHLVDDRNPQKTGSALGWEQLERPKILLGDYILQNAYRWHPESIVFMADMDEFPAVDTLLWAKTHVNQGQTAVFDTRYFLYNFRWLFAPVSRAQMTVRQLRDETRYWTHKKINGRSEFPQHLISPPPNVQSGYHCGYCQTSDLNVLKLKYSNVIDGPPFLTEYFWDVEIFTKLRSCGVSPRCTKLTRAHQEGDAFSLYVYGDGTQTDTCDVIHISLTDWHRINPELQTCQYVQWNISQN